MESPAERIERAKEQFAAVTITAVDVDTSGKDTDSNGKKDEPVNKAVSAVSGLQVETGLTPSMRKLSVGSKPESGNEGSPKAKRERKKSKSKGGDEKSGEEGDKKQDGDKKEDATPKTPTRTTASGDTKSPKKKSPEKSSKSPSPKKASQEIITSEKKEEAS